MSAEQIKETYITVPEIMTETGQHRSTVYNWLKYHRYMPYEEILGRPVVKREDFAQFKIDHPELINPPIAA